mmetsp:Transcript_11350/g.27031  ORF Transcript_11350/g.27031 Transcript_11350/m.27031 type:complete len:570 (-) Transcript_11350:1083-2792(-)
MKALFLRTMHCPGLSKVQAHRCLCNTIPTIHLRNITDSTTAATTIKSTTTRNREDLRPRHRPFFSSSTVSFAAESPPPTSPLSASASSVVNIDRLSDKEEENSQIDDDASSQDSEQQRPTSPVQSSAAVTTVPPQKQHQRVWMPNSSVEPLYWNDDIVSRSSIDDDDDLHLYGGQKDSGPSLPSGGSRHHNNSNHQQRRQTKHSQLETLLERIERQEVDGGRMRAKQYGVLHEDPTVDMRLLVENYTVASLASALRDREEMLQMASQLAKDGEFELLQRFLEDSHPDVVLEKRRNLRRLDLSKPLNTASLETIRKGLMRMPRRVTTAHSKRAGVVIALVHVDGVPSILLEKRSPHLRAHPDEVCLPGGMVCEMNDSTIVETCLREMKEEVGGFDFEYHTGVATAGGGGSGSGRGGVSVLGILRCNWGEVHHLVGVAVTPVVCFFNQDLDSVDLKPNPNEVAEVFTGKNTYVCFLGDEKSVFSCRTSCSNLTSHLLFTYQTNFRLTVPLESLLDKSQWIYKDDHAPIFVGGPYVIFGLTGYILERFWRDILLPFHSSSTDQHHSFPTSRR